MFTRILCAVDRSVAAANVMRHAAGLANAMGASLVIVHVGRGDDAALARARVELDRDFQRAIPYQASYAVAADLRVVRGERATAIIAQAAYTRSDLIVMGTRGFGNLTGWAMASTTRLVMQLAVVPMLLIPENGRDLLTLGPDRAHLHCGPVLAAVDPDERNDAQLVIASQFAALAHQPLMLLTVIPESADVDAVHDALWARAREITPSRPRLLLVRHGQVAREIGRAALTEGTGLVVMGLRNPGAGERPGHVATAVLHTRSSCILAVPDTTRINGRLVVSETCFTRGDEHEPMPTLPDPAVRGGADEHDRAGR